jgi:hypothetical protein
MTPALARQEEQEPLLSGGQFAASTDSSFVIPGLFFLPSRLAVTSPA